MKFVQRSRTMLASRHMAQGCLVVFAATLGGCSADVTRFDFPAFNLSEGSASTGSLPAASDPQIRRGSSAYDGPLTTPRGAGMTGEATRGDYAPYPAQNNRPSVTSTELAPTSERYAARTPDRALPDRVPADRAPSAERRMEPPRVATSGESIEVQQGDTLFGIAKRHGVPVGALIEVNGLQNGATIKPGQRLALPAGATPARALPETTNRASAGNRAADTQGWGGRYTLNPGDSLYAIARQHHVTLAELQRINGITDPTKVRAGTVLMVPGSVANDPAPDRVGSTGGSSLPQTTTTTTSTIAPRVVQAPDGGPGAPKILNGAVGDTNRTAARNDTATDAVEASTGKFRWPVTGRVIANFGKRPDGTHNDGINVAVPQGTEVRAAEGGRVAYAGNELKGYGNLVLIRHDNGYVTAYAHSEEILVKRDDVVKRGQVIARAGKTGTVDQPQVHFELRQGAKPIDPLPYMDRN